ncbi:RNA polymerase sigma factor [Formosa haliotis]|uniref:RNA polymerase sigma factor n=1 Tax=Formosa haliotis TaxID=1555194 RepID=UPI00082569B3|nr:hypothetical protein [Formosa haliotis]
MTLAGKNIVYTSKEFKVIFERFYPHLYALASRLLESEQAGKIVSHQVFVNLGKHEGVFKDELDLQTYLYTAVKLECENKLRT